MSMSDNIADMLARIRNAQIRNYLNLVIPFSELKQSILLVLVEAGYIENCIKSDNELIVTLKYTKTGRSVINKLIKISKPGRRVYFSIRDLKLRKSNMGLFVLSTCKGVLSDSTARDCNVGGEVLLEIS